MNSKWTKTVSRPTCTRRVPSLSCFFSSLFTAHCSRLSSLFTLHSSLLWSLLFMLLLALVMPAPVAAETPLAIEPLISSATRLMIFSPHPDDETLEREALSSESSRRAAR